jgi:hypothetical protein
LHLRLPLRVLRRGVQRLPLLLDHGLVVAHAALHPPDRGLDQRLRLVLRRSQPSGRQLPRHLRNVDRQAEAGAAADEDAPAVLCWEASHQRLLQLAVLARGTLELAPHSSLQEPH